MKATFNASCHCGAVRFRCELDASQPTSRCNCSICAKTRFWKAFVPAAAFTLTQGDAALTEYRFAGRRIAHRFCRHCGVKLFGFGDGEHFPEPFYAVNVACFDDLTDEFKAALTIVYQDGRHDAWQNAPGETARL
ncbi:MAG TPA: GFA family protein [Burkholderiaceae bacterium]|jgi:hypothetical protein